MPVTSHHSGALDDQAPMTVEDPAENAELGRGILGIIDAYRMGAALDAKDLYRAGSTVASPSERATSRS